MKLRLLLLSSVIGIIALSSCKNNGNHFTVVGHITNMPKQKLTLEELSANDVISVIDSATSENGGNFELSGTAPEPGLYRIHFSKSKYILLAIDKGDLKVTGDWNTLENYQVTGSAPSASLKGFMVGIREHLRDFNS